MRKRRFTIQDIMASTCCVALAVALWTLWPSQQFSVGILKAAATCFLLGTAVSVLVNDHPYSYAIGIALLLVIIFGFLALIGLVVGAIR